MAVSNEYCAIADVKARKQCHENSTISVATVVEWLDDLKKEIAYKEIRRSKFWRRRHFPQFTRKHNWERNIPQEDDLLRTTK